MATSSMSTALRHRIVFIVGIVVFMVSTPNVAMVTENVALNEAFIHALGEVSVKSVVSASQESGLNSTCKNRTNDYAGLRACLTTQCISRDDVSFLYGITVDTRLRDDDLKRVTPGLLYAVTQPQSCSSDAIQEKEKPSAAAVWGYGFLFVTIINLLSLLGAVVLPCMNLKVYKTVLMFLVSLAVGTLVGSGLLVLIPEALDLGAVEGEHTEDPHWFVWKTTTVMGGIYLFFLVERIMRMVNSWRETNYDTREQNEQATHGNVVSTFRRLSPDDPQIRLKDPSIMATTAYTNTSFEGDTEGRSSTLDLKENAGNGFAGDKGAGKPERKRIAPVAYMIIFGDALHNCIDGLSIGAAFTESTLLGISVCVAVICEELPHELGDFAILLNSGMTVRKALIANFLSSLSCYLGLIIGIVLGENTSANTYIFALAGGMFLYISLADMLPEMNTSADSEEGQEFGMMKTFFLQNFGLLFGFGIILILAVFGENINFE